VEDIPRVKAVLKTAGTLVRCNPLNPQTKKEVEQSILAGADALMLPMFDTATEVREFLDLVDGRAKVFLLAETIGAIRSLSTISAFEGVHAVHIGLNDLSIQLKCSFMFEPFVNGVIDEAAHVLRQRNVPFGVGGIAQLGEGLLPAEKILGEHIRVGSSCVILSRSFLNSGLDSDLDLIRSEFIFELKKIRDYSAFLETLPPEYFSLNHEMVKIVISSLKK
jgi:2-keto-3-deoxy-L-rhamnonate aldolase RhmA